MTFDPLEIRTGLLLDLYDDEYPARVFGWNNANLALLDGATHYGMVTAGSAILTHGPDSLTIRAGMFFVVPGAGSVSCSAGQGLVISRLGYTGLRQIGGPLESQGRLVYIDGCSDTLLVCPPRLGEPCLNHLHIPPGTSQTAHTHPSVRLGVILRGCGECRTPDGVFPLKPGMAWRIPTGSLHSFFTSEDSLDVIAWHPDSDFGPTDANHPMKNRTIIEEQ